MGAFVKRVSCVFGNLSVRTVLFLRTQGMWYGLIFGTKWELNTSLLTMYVTLIQILLHMNNSLCDAWSELAHFKASETRLTPSFWSERIYYHYSSLLVMWILELGLIRCSDVRTNHCWFFLSFSSCLIHYPELHP